MAILNIYMYFYCLSTVNNTTQHTTNPWLLDHTLSLINTALINIGPFFTFSFLFFLMSIILPFITATSDFFRNHEKLIHIIFILLAIICLSCFILFYLYGFNIYNNVNLYKNFITDYVGFQLNNKSNLTQYEAVKLSLYNSLAWELFVSQESFSQVDLINSSLDSNTKILDSIKSSLTIKYTNLVSNINNINVNYERALAKDTLNIVQNLNTILNNIIIPKSNLLDKCNNVTNSNLSEISQKLSVITDENQRDSLYNTILTNKMSDIQSGLQIITDLNIRSKIYKLSEQDQIKNAINSIENCKSNFNYINQKTNFFNRQPYSNSNDLIGNMFIPTISCITNPNMSYTIPLDTNLSLYYDNAQPQLLFQNQMILAPENKLIDNLSVNNINLSNDIISIDLNLKSTIQYYLKNNSIILQGVGVSPNDPNFFYPTIIIIPSSIGIYLLTCEYSLNKIRNIQLMTPANKILTFISQIISTDTPPITTFSNEFSINPINNIYETDYLYSYVKNTQLTTKLNFQNNSLFNFKTTSTQDIYNLVFQMNCEKYITNYALYTFIEVIPQTNSYCVYLYYGTNYINQLSDIHGNYLKINCNLDKKHKQLIMNFTDKNNVNLGNQSITYN